ncbi:NAD(P)-dependent oxidoreductase [Halobellus captivus]|uniref:NAD(P)-dependent oxidoreductase n=1 Tax=Halobellus captivus TaxID=2592614 RepID=UPI001396C54C|nr:NAD(P)-dependent oxidoreductase [Halobellus captivus]
MPEITVGQIGLGSMGGSVAKCLIDDGFDVLGFDISEEACDSLSEYGGDIAASGAEVAAESDILLTALNYPEIVEEVYLGDGGIVEGAHDGLVCIEQSTIPPEPARQLAKELDERGIEMLDAPFLSGGPQFARNGTMVLPIGGDRALYDDEDIQSVLASMSREFHYMGAVGNGKATKLVSNIMALGHVVLSLEALSLGVAQGLDSQDLFETLKYGAGSSVMFRVAVPSALNRDFSPSFPVKSSQKDLRFALRAGEDIDFPMHVTNSILQLYTAAAASGYADEGSSAVVKVFEEWTGSSLESDDEVEVDIDDPVYTA